MSSKAQLANLKKLLLSRDIDPIRQGLELVASLEDPEVWGALLDGVTYHENGLRPPLSTGRKSKPTDTYGRFESTELFASNSKSVLWDEIVLAHLVARSSSPLREEVTGLSLGGAKRYDQNVSAFLQGLDAFPNLARLHINIGNEPLDLTPLGGLPTLTELHVHGGGNYAHRTTANLAGLPKLETLKLSGALAATVTDLPALTWAEVTCQLDDGQGLVNTRELRVNSWAQLNPGFIEDCHRVETFWCWTTSVPVARFPQGARLDSGVLNVSHETTDLGNIASLAGLEVVDLLRHPGPLTVDSLAECPELRVVDLRDSAVSDVSALAGHPELRMIAAAGSAVDADSLPESMAKVVSFAKKPDLEKARLRPKPGEKRKHKKTSGVPVSPDAKRALARLKKLLQTPDAASIVQGVELVASLDSDEVLSVLLDGVTYSDSQVLVDKDDRQRHPAAGRLVPNKIFTGSLYRQPWLDIALALVVANSETALRSEVRALTLGQWSYSTTPLDTMPLVGIERFPNLREVELLFDFRTACNLTPLADCPVLEALHMGRGQEIVVPGLDRLRRLSIDGAVFDDQGTWPQLEELTVRQGKEGVDFAKLAESAPRLESLKIVGGNVPLTGFINLRALEVTNGVVVVDRSPALESVRMTGGSLRSPSGVPSLEALELSRVVVRDLDFLAEAGPLETLSLSGIHALERFAAPLGSQVDRFLDLSETNLVDLGNCGELDGLAQLDLGGLTKPLELDTLSHADELRVLDIRGSTGITDLSPLVGLPELRMIAARGSGVVDVPPELKPMVSRAMQPDLDKAFDRDPPNPRTTPLPIPVPEDQRMVWQRVEVGLATSKQEVALEAVDLAATLHPDGVEYLLGKAQIEGERLRARRPFRLGSPTDVPAVVGRLLTHASPESLNARRFRKMKKLRIEGRGWNEGRAELKDLEHFPSLEHLVVLRTGTIDAGSLADAAHLHTLSLQAGRKTTLGPLPDSLRRLAVARGVAVDLSPLASSNVEELVIVEAGYNADLSALAGAQKLRSLRMRVYGVAEGVEALGAVPVEELELPSKTDMTTLSHHPTLSSLRITRQWGSVGLDNVPADLLHLADIADIADHLDAGIFD